MPKNLFPLDNTKKFTDQLHVGHNRWHPDIPAVVNVKPGDVLTVALPHDVRVMRVVSAGKRRGPSTEARLLYIDLSASSERDAEEGEADD